MSTVPEQELQVVYTTLYQIRLVNYVTLSSATLLVYDILTNLDKEISFIWRYYHNAEEPYAFVPWNRRLRRMVIQGVCIFGRYYGLFYLIVYFAGMAFSSSFVLLSNSIPVYNHESFSVPSCRGFYYYTIFAGGILYTTLVNVILVMRLNVFYQTFYGVEGLQKYQFFLVGVVSFEYLVELIMGILSAIWVRDRVVEPPAGVPWPGCVLSEDPGNALVLPTWIIAILVATALFGCTLHLVFSSMRRRLRSFRDFTISNIREEIKGLQPISQILMRDTVLFYISMFVMLVTSIAANSVFHNFLSLVTSPLFMALSSFYSSRFIIHTRESIAKSTNRWQVEDLDLSTLSDPCR
ncbi:hypothetical protein F5J12DRAFT_914423 [Pisolithus orientalis]|uniref:uncharacterized protein n=1 Tax=Pisolithus orientalis TaxID=936130 RepID=UPI0022248871|nr:uncharacterized protein F5J12DRAFT_914423 [Pisolithus orientalis]KAI5999818.1 hypothetical protein F5J12DRAFT_914423 [Pisolithus orientalis]